MKISQEDAILIKNVYLSKQYSARRLLSELPNKGWKLGSLDSLLKRIRKTGTIVQQPGGSKLRSVCSSGGPCAQSEGQAKRASISLWDFAWSCNVNRIIHCDLQPKCFKQCRALELITSRVSLANNYIVCNKSCYCSIINRQLNNN